MRSGGGNVLTFIFGILGIIAPFASIRLAGSAAAANSEIAAFNSMMLLLLSVLLLVFLVINCFGNYINNRKKMFISGAIFLCLGTASFVWSLLVFVGT